MKNLYKVTVFLIPDGDGGHAVHIPLFPGCITGGETVDEALANAKEALELLVEDATEDDLQNLEDSRFEHVTIGEIDVEVPVRDPVRISD